MAEVEGSAQGESHLAERLAVGYTAGACALGITLGVIHAGEIVPLVAARSKVDTGREGL